MAASLPIASDTTWLLVFRIDLQRYALPLASVLRVVRAVAITPLPDAPDVVLGLVDLAGELLPVFSLRRRFGAADRSLSLADHLVIARAAERTVALLIDGVTDVVQYPESSVLHVAEFVPEVERICGVVRLADGLVLIQDLDRLLSRDEAHELDAALAAAHTRAG